MTKVKVPHHRTSYAVIRRIDACWTPVPDTTVLDTTVPDTTVPDTTADSGAYSGNPVNAACEWRSWLIAAVGTLLLYLLVTGLGIYLLPFSTFNQLSMLIAKCRSLDVAIGTDDSCHTNGCALLR